MSRGLALVRNEAAAAAENKKGDAVPAADCAGKAGSFPISTPQDVADAAASVGRAGPDNYTPEELKKRIVAIAKRKGAAFVAKLPKSWRPEEPAKNAFARVAFNLAPKVRHDQMAGKEYLVVPMVMMTEGVHNGSLGPLLYPGDEFGKLPQAWNMKPVVVYHPVGNDTACDPSVIDSQGVGVILNTRVVEEGEGDKRVVKLAAEAWLEEARLRKVDDRVLEALEAGRTLEVSTGLFTVATGEAGEWRGEAYNAEARSWAPDHLAILPDVKGACSIADGAGLLRNEEAAAAANEASFDAVRGLVSTALAAENGPYSTYVTDVFSKFFVYSKGDKLYMRNYSATDTAATLEGDPVEVVRVVQYRSPDGAVYNSERNLDTMDKKKVVAAIIAASAGVFAVADSPLLMAKNEDQLVKLAGTLGLNKEGEKADLTPAPAPAAVANATPPQPPPPPRVMTLNEYISGAPPEVARLLGSALRNAEAAKNSLIEAVAGSPRCGYSKEQLQAKEIEELQILARGFGVDSPQAGAPTYAGLADAFGAPRAAAAANVETPLALPTWNMLEDTPAVK